VRLLSNRELTHHGNLFTFDDRRNTFLWLSVDHHDDEQFDGLSTWHGASESLGVDVDQLTMSIDEVRVRSVVCQRDTSQPDFAKRGMSGVIGEVTLLNVESRTR
jgi:hypothetical protein